ncbi:hypothetical protein BC835DRAFT_1424549 [Cytidiella melzeri]|nr:hypothetical protein BC835DRAFT_1424549 [Cytidiella melzeri]
MQLSTSLALLAAVITGTFICTVTVSAAPYSSAESCSPSSSSKFPHMERCSPATGHFAYPDAFGQDHFTKRQMPEPDEATKRLGETVKDLASFEKVMGSERYHAIRALVEAGGAMPDDPKERQLAEMIKEFNEASTAPG